MEGEKDLKIYLKWTTQLFLGKKKRRKKSGEKGGSKGEDGREKEDSTLHDARVKKGERRGGEKRGQEVIARPCTRKRR